MMLSLERDAKQKFPPSQRPRIQLAMRGWRRNQEPEIAVRYENLAGSLAGVSAHSHVIFRSCQVLNALNIVALNCWYERTTLYCRSVYHK